MSFEDLADDWKQQPLTDPRLVADVLDLCVSDADRCAVAVPTEQGWRMLSGVSAISVRTTNATTC